MFYTCSSLLLHHVFSKGFHNVSSKGFAEINLAVVIKYKDLSEHTSLVSIFSKKIAVICEPFFYVIFYWAIKQPKQDLNN